MPKQLINTIGTMIVVAILAIGIAAVAVPLLLQSFTTMGEAARVATENAQQEADILALSEQSNSSALERTLGELQAEIPQTPLIYTVSQLISDAATSTGVTVTGITPNAPALFTGSQASEPVATDAKAEAVVGRAQIPVEISVIAGSHTEIVAFIDALRGGPRLLGDIEATISSRGGADATIKALAFADIAPGVADDASGADE